MVMYTDLYIAMETGSTWHYTMQMKIQACFEISSELKSEFEEKLIYFWKLIMCSVVICSVTICIKKITLHSVNHVKTNTDAQKNAVNHFHYYEYILTETGNFPLVVFSTE